MLEEDVVHVPPVKLFESCNVDPLAKEVALPAAVIEGMNPATKLELVPVKAKPENVPVNEFDVRSDKLLTDELVALIVP